MQSEIKQEYNHLILPQPDIYNGSDNKQSCNNILRLESVDKYNLMQKEFEKSNTNYIIQFRKVFSKQFSKMYLNIGGMGLFV